MRHDAEAVAAKRQASAIEAELSLDQSWIENRGTETTSICVQAAAVPVQTRQPDPRLEELLRAAALSHRAGRLDKARKALEDLVELAPDHAHAQYNLGIIHRDQGHIFDAERAFRRALKSDPTMVDGYQALADLLFNAKHLLAALTFYDKAIELAPNKLPILHNAAKARLLLKQAVDVERLTRRILTIDDKSVEACWQLAWALSIQGRELNAALGWAEHGISVNPNSGHCLAVRQHILEGLGRTLEADQAWCGIRQVSEKNWRAHKQICELYLWLGEVEKSRELSLAYAANNPNDVEAFHELGTIMMSEGDFAGSQEFLDRALSLAPGNPILKMVKGLNAFRMGRYREGLELYEARWQRDSLETRWDIPVPEWDGSDIGDRPLVVYSEQGIGDYVMFGGLFSELRARARSVVIEVNSRMHRLFWRTFPDFRIIDRREMPASWDHSRIGAKTGMGDLPLLLDADIERLPNRQGYLIPDVNLARGLRDKYRRLFPGKRLVGISWRSGSRDSATIRSIDLTLLAPMLRDPNSAFISLQYGDNARDLAHLEAETGIKIHWDRSVDPLGDMDPFAAQIAALDLVISVDNSTVHFAGALGKPCWVLLPVNSDWRWLLGRESSVWYESLYLHRLERGQGWEHIVGPLTRKLAGLDGNSLVDHTAEMCRRCGEVMLAAGKFSEAEGFFRWLLELERHIGPAMHGIGIVARACGEPADAVGILARAVELAPDRIDYRADLCLALENAGEKEVAFQLARELTRKGDDRAALLAMGQILAGRGQPDLATDYIARVLQSSPGDVEARRQLAELQDEQGEYDLAERNYRKILECQPSHCAARAAIGEMSLRKCEVTRAVEDFAYRFGTRPDELPAHLSDIAYDERPDLWAGQKLRRKRIYLRPERHLVEQILFASIMRWLGDRCGTILGECDPRLMRLLSDAFPKAEFMAAGQATSRDLVTRRIGLFSSLGDIALASNRRTSPSTAWLRADVSVSSQWRQEYCAVLPGRFLVGLCWRCASRIPGGNRGQLALNDFRSLFDDSNLLMVSLHPGDVASELETFADQSGSQMVFDDRVQRSGDLGMLVAQIAALDMVVSVDDLVLALASAMGKRAFKLAGGNEHWSWGREGTQSSWWPNITIIRADGGNLVRSIATAHAEVARLAANARVIRSV